MSITNRPQTVHNLKTWLPFLADIKRGAKTFEIRKNDRDYQVGDILNLQEWDQSKGRFTGTSALLYVTYVLPGGAFGLHEDFVALGVRFVSATPLT